MSASAPVHQKRMLGWLVLVIEERNATLTPCPSLRYESPPHSETDARRLIELLNGDAPTGPGPWRHAIAGGQRTIELRQATPDASKDHGAIQSARGARR
jgi:hypothetical protein